MSDIKDFVIENGVLKGYTGSEEHIVIPDGVRTIERGAFDSFCKATRITIHSGVKKLQLSCLPRNITVYAPPGSAADLFVKKNSTLYSFEPFGEPVNKKTAAEMPKGKASPKKAVEVLEQAILSRDVQKVAQVVAKYKPFEFQARALGLACRTGNMDIVKCLVDNKFNFTYKTTDKTLNSKYALCFKPSSYKYHADFSLLTVVSDIWDKYLFGSIEKSFPPESIQIGTGKYCKTEKFVSDIPQQLALAPSEERAAIISFLYKKKKISDVKINLLLYYAVLENDKVIIDVLDSLGAVIDVPWLDSKKYDASYVSEYHRFLDVFVQKNEEAQKCILKNLNKYMKKAGCLLNVRESFIEESGCRYDADFAVLITENADISKINKTKLMKSLISKDTPTEAFIVFLDVCVADSKLLYELMEAAREESLTEIQVVLMNSINKLRAE